MPHTDLIQNFTLSQVEITDGVHGVVAVTPPNTAAVPGDPALVVAISPNTPISVVATNASIGLNGAPAPTSSTQSGGSDGVNLQAERVFDLDTGPGSEWSLGVSIRLPSIGGSVAGGTVSNPFRIDPVGTTPQPVSQGAGAAAGAPWSVALSDGAAFYIGAKTGQFPAALLGGRLDTNVGSWLGATTPTVGQKTSAASLPVVIASDQTAVPVSGTVTANQGTANTAANGWPTKITDGVSTAAVKAASTPSAATDPALVVALSPNSPGPFHLDPAGDLYVADNGAPSNALRVLASGRIVGVANSLQAIRATAYTEQAASAIRSVASASANDTGAGTGAQQITITGYNSTLTTLLSEVITMNGVTAVPTVNSYRFIESIKVTRVGSNNSNVGVITLFVNNAGGGGTIGTIGTANLVAGRGDNTTFWAHHYVLSGATSNITSFQCGSAGNQGGYAFLMAVDPTVTTAVESPVTGIISFSASTDSVVRPLSTPVRVTGPARITEYVVPAGANTTFSGDFDLWEL